MVESHREVGDHLAEETRYYLTSLPCDATQFAKAVQGHWGVENSLYWVLDVTFREDDCRIRKEKGALPP
jgi:predicted transposase YbfD/YdcC